MILKQIRVLVAASELKLCKNLDDTSQQVDSGIA